MSRNPNPLFVIGNKRSGNARLQRALNAHPNIYVASDSDAVWALHQRAERKPIERYPADGRRALDRTVDLCSDILSGNASAKDALPQMLARFAEQDGKKFSDAKWAGEMKPVQHADPDVFSFIRKTWPDSRFLHVVRHPLAVLAARSDRAQGRLSTADLWRRSDSEMLAFWTQNERRVLAHKKAGAPIHTVRSRDLAGDVGATFDGILTFLGLPRADSRLRTQLQGDVKGPDRQPDKDSAVGLTPEAEEIVAHYQL